MEAKSHGFDCAIMRQVVRIRKMDPTKRSTNEEMISLYMNALEGYKE